MRITLVAIGSALLLLGLTNQSATLNGATVLWLLGLSMIVGALCIRERTTDP